MKCVYLRVLSLFVLLFSVVSYAAIDTYEFNDEQTRERFHQLNGELRCPKCQNQSLGDSNSPISTDLRAQVYRLLNEGKSDQQIKDYLVERYGEYILYRPELAGHTLMLWLAPLAFLVLGLAVVLVLVIRRRNTVQSGGLDTTEQQDLEKLLADSGQGSAEATSEVESNKRD